MAEEMPFRVNVSTTFDTYCPRCVLVNRKCIRICPGSNRAIFKNCTKFVFYSQILLFKDANGIFWMGNIDTAG